MNKQCSEKIRPHYGKADLRRTFDFFSQCGRNLPGILILKEIILECFVNMAKTNKVDTAYGLISIWAQRNMKKEEIPIIIRNLIERVCR